MIKTPNKFDYQKNYECSAYASAYVLRSLGEDIDGLTIYDEITNKNSDGTVPPSGIINYFKTTKYKATKIEGDLNSLKRAVCKDVPVIVLIAMEPDSEYSHYLPVVGYDSEYIYLADSLPYMVTEETEYYNRKMKISDFLAVWDTSTLQVKNLYITVE